MWKHRKRILLSLCTVAITLTATYFALLGTRLELTGGFGMAAWRTDPKMYAGVAAVFHRNFLNPFVKLENMHVVDYGGFYIFSDAWVWEQPYVKSPGSDFHFDDTVFQLQGFSMAKVAPKLMPGMSNTYEYPSKVRMVVELEWTGKQGEPGSSAGPFMVSLTYSFLGIKRTTTSLTK